jgi:uncharacterized repeat protein (TIGR01451 family)
VITGNVADPNDASAAPLPGTDSSDFGYGGGLYLFGMKGTVRNSTISGNTAALGGGVYIWQGSDMTFENVTIDGNSAKSPATPFAIGGGVRIEGFQLPTKATFNETTITNNTSGSGGGGVDVDTAGGASSATFYNSIVANNTSGAVNTPDIRSGGTVTATYTLIKTPGIATIGGGTGNITGSDPALGALQDNGSTINAGAAPTQHPKTELPGCNSPVINAGDPAFVGPPNTDERGKPRVAAGRIDMGAAEFQPSSVQFSVATQSIGESAGNVVVVAQRTGTDGVVSVNYATADGTAKGAASGAGTPDYTPKSGVLTWPDGNNTDIPTNIAITPDTVFEGNENFTVTLSAPTCFATLGANSTDTITIVDDDLQPTISINSVSANEGNAGTTPFNFTVSLSNASTQTITVNYTTADNTATVAAVGPGNPDYSLATGSVTFLPGEVSKPIVVNVNGDTVNEPNETFNVNLSAPTNATISAGTGTGTIQNDDGTPTLSINSVSQAEGNAATTPMNFTVTLSPASGQTVTVNYATAGGTATAPSDYTATSGTLIFNPGTTTQQISVPIVGDTNFEPDETFTVNLTVPSNATITTGTGTGTILNDDAGNADVSITKTAVSPAIVGQTLTYSIVVSNAGPAAAASVVVTDVIPANTTFVSATPSQGSCSGTTTVTCSLGTINNGAQASISLKVTPTAPAPVSNTATVSAAPQPDANPANNTATENVTAHNAGDVPALGDWAKIFLALTVALLGFFKIKHE